MNKRTFRGYSINTTWRPIPQLGNWPLDHVFVSTTESQCWNCFARGIDKVPNAKVIAQGEAHLAWVQKLVGKVTKVHCADSLSP